MNEGIKSILIHLIWVSTLWGEENVGAKMDVSDNNKCELNEASISSDSSNTHLELSDAKMSKDEFFAEFAVFMYFYWAIVIGICVVVAMWFFSSLRGGNNQQKAKEPKAKESKAKPKPNVSNTSNTNNTNQKVAIKEETVAIKEEKDAIKNEKDVIKNEKAIKRIETTNDANDFEKCVTKTRKAIRICSFCGVYISNGTKYEFKEANALCLNCELEQNELEQLAGKLDGDISMSIIERIESSQYVFPDTGEEKEKEKGKNVEKEAKNNEQWNGFVDQIGTRVDVDGNTATLRNVMRSFNEFKDSISPSMGNVKNNDSDQ